jgi:hypothetical protein
MYCEVFNMDSDQINSADLTMRISISVIIVLEVYFQVYHWDGGERVIMSYQRALRPVTMMHGRL